MTLTTRFFRIPTPAIDANLKALAAEITDEIVSVTGTSLTLSAPSVASTVKVYKNGARLASPSEYTVEGQTVTLGVAAIVTDVFVIDYRPRLQR